MISVQENHLFIYTINIKFTEFSFESKKINMLMHLWKLSESKCVWAHYEIWNIRLHYHHICLSNAEILIKSFETLSVFSSEWSALLKPLNLHKHVFFFLWAAVSNVTRVLIITFTKIRKGFLIGYYLNFSFDCFW